MRKQIATVLGFLVACILVITGCQKQDHFISTDPQIQKILNMAGPAADKSMEEELIFLRDVMGHNLSNGNYHISTNEDTRNEPSYGFADVGSWEVIIDAITRKEVQRKMKEYYSTTGSVNRHRINSPMATTGSKVINILNGVPTSYTTAIANARTEWNNLGQGLTFTAQAGGNTTVSGAINVSYIDFSTSSIVISGYPLSSAPNAVAAGTPPSSSGGVRNLYINSNTGSKANWEVNLTASQKKFVLAHELGHCIGFCHTDTNDGYAIANVTSLTNCRNNADTGSVLQAGTSPVPSWSSFSPCDITVFSYYYGNLS